ELPTAVTDRRGISGAERGRTPGILFADRAAPRQPTEITRVSVGQETASVCRDCMVGDAGIELMAIPSLVGVPAKRGGVSRISCGKRSDAANVKVARGQTEGANYESLFASKPQISLAFDPQESNGLTCSGEPRR